MQAGDPGEIEWELVPRGDHGLRAATGAVAEEGNLVQMQASGAFYAVMHTTDHYLAVATSLDGVDWKDRQFAEYAPGDYGDAMYMTKLKNPTGPITPRRFKNGHFLLTLFADAQQGDDLFGNRRRDP